MRTQLRARINSLTKQINLVLILFFAGMGMLFITDQSYEVFNLDYYQDYYAAISFQKGTPIYQQIFANDWIIQNAHPPITTLLFLPLTLFPVKLSYFIYNTFSFLLITSSLFLLAKYFKLLSTPYFLPLLALLFWPPVLELYRFGQTNSIILFCIIFFLTQINTQKKSLASVFLGIAMALKLFPALLCVGLLRHKRYKELSIAIASFIILNLIALLVLGRQDFTYYYTVVSKVNTATYILINNNISLPAIVGAFFLHMPFASPVVYLPKLANGLIITSTAGLVLFDLFSPANLKERLLYLSLIMTMITPIMWDHFLLITIPSYLFLLQSLPYKNMSDRIWLISSFLIISVPSFYIRSIYLNHLIMSLSQFNFYQVMLSKIQGIGLIMLVIYFIYYRYKKFGLDWSFKPLLLSSGK